MSDLAARDPETLFRCVDVLLGWSNAVEPKGQREAALWDAAWNLLDAAGLTEAYLQRGRPVCEIHDRERFPVMIAGELERNWPIVAGRCRKCGR